MRWVEPTLSDHALSRKIHNHSGLHPIDQLQQLCELTVEVKRLKVEIVLRGQWLTTGIFRPAVGQKNRIWLE